MFLALDEGDRFRVRDDFPDLLGDEFRLLAAFQEALAVAHKRVVSKCLGGFNGEDVAWCRALVEIERPPATPLRGIIDLMRQKAVAASSEQDSVNVARILPFDSIAAFLG